MLACTSACVCLYACVIVSACACVRVRVYIISLDALICYCILAFLIRCCMLQVPSKQQWMGVGVCLHMSVYVGERERDRM